MARLPSSLLGRLLLVVPGAIAGLTVDVDDQASIKKGAALVAEDLMNFYTGDIPGILPADDYSWWTGGALWSTLLDYRDRTGDTTYDDTIYQGLRWQTGSNSDFAPANWSSTLGNDDQSIWALAALVAAETGFTSPPSGDPQWLDLAQTVFDEQTSRLINSGNCEGTLRWQIFTFNSGYNYVNTASNAAYFSVGAQLAHLQQNQTAADLATAVYEKIADLGFVDDAFNVYDGASAPQCSAVDKVQFTYTAGMLIQGTAYMYNFTSSPTWKSRLDGLLNRTVTAFFPAGVAAERACADDEDACGADARFYKGLLHRAMAAAARAAPHTAGKVRAALRPSAQAAADQCTGGDGGRLCGGAWASGAFDDSDAGAQMSVLGALVSVSEGEGEGGDATGTSATGTETGTAETSAVVEGGGMKIRASFWAVAGGLVVAGGLGLA
ncbi:glycoside hydrolase family 76 protein [Biscogniauxia sp. FL1348]|nr:glycoside hydrolase family 76 protein [Biscogniauxia sp. FL1348]